MQVVRTWGTSAICGTECNIQDFRNGGSIFCADTAIKRGLCNRFWIGGKHCLLDRPYTELRKDSLLVAPTRAKTKKGQKEAPPVIPQRDLLAQVCK
jgi:hypothetical protein